MSLTPNSSAPEGRGTGAVSVVMSIEFCSRLVFVEIHRPTVRR
ncbi:hypothetical protein MA6G0728R_5485 [Mycobacteroides abscessus 6G-0728-R]|nr:hypothetical protein MA6G0728S_5455 [Mycobacteroides abscessus 6G-0728-S]EIU74656.1 hypothetical protein MA6G1108_5280 [Mycobacteroides abscessus 6G-1108]EIV03181.1 hypothetical protein MA6G0728R_5485 [Mycobacteroides abscessus 6G-0728-R]